MKIANLNNTNPLLFLSSISFVSLIVLDFFFKEKRFENYSLLIILILTFPIYTIYQKYFDPLLILVLTTITTGGQLNEIIEKNKLNLITLFLYFGIFLIASNIYYR